jgi:hypothetical protein
MAGVTQMDVPVVRGIQNTIEGMRAAAIAAEAAYAALLASDIAESFCCFGANAAIIAYHAHCVSALHKFQTICGEGADKIKDDIAAITGADQADAGTFTGGSGAAAADPAAMLAKFQRSVNFTLTVLQGHGVPVNIKDYQSGVDGWSLISTDGSQGFTPNELVSQIGGTCALYAPQNLLIESGYDISQADANKVAHDTLRDNVPWWFNAMDMPDGKWTKGFDMDVTESVVAKTTSHYHTGDFNEVSVGKGFFGSVTYGPNRGKAEEFLTKTVQGGQPVLIDMQVDDSFGMGSGGHAATVVGVKTGSDGKMESVLVGTNWAGSPVYEVPAKQFMDDWMDREGGRYITVDRAPTH